MFNKTRTNLQMQRSVKPSLQLLLRQRTADQQQPDNFIHPAPASCRSQETALCVCESSGYWWSRQRKDETCPSPVFISFAVSCSLLSLCPSSQSSELPIHPSSCLPHTIIFCTPSPLPPVLTHNATKCYAATMCPHGTEDIRECAWSDQSKDLELVNF